VPGGITDGHFVRVYIDRAEVMDNARDLRAGSTRKHSDSSSSEAIIEGEFVVDN